MNRRFLALGDSYTIGEAVAPPERWPRQLADRLRTQGVNLTALEIVATTGWTTDELAAGIVEADPQGPFDIVSLLIGVNNQYRGWAQPVYRQEFAELLQQALRFAGDLEKRVMVVSIPDWSVVPFAAEDERSPAQIAAEVAAFNEINRAEAARAGVHYVDVTPVSRQAAVDPALTAVDGLHPSGKMYGLWVDLILPVAADILRE